MKKKKKRLKVLFCGSFKFFEEMEKIALECRRLGFDCYLPKFAFAASTPAEIEKIKEIKKRDGLREEEFAKVIRVKERFYRLLRECDVVVVFDKDGYIGLSVAAEIGAAHILGKPTLFIEEPEDIGLRALLRFSPHFKVVPLRRLPEELRNLDTWRQKK